ncbi:MAG: c-type cytochrome, partial [Gammaproteobacteria bacterium]|nr:c-type cytochrome [Gammaproteobacteria bacterium]
HSWWVPALAAKKDAVPGFVNELWFEIEEPGVYRGQCAELCGRDHGFMPVVVEALTEEDYTAWVAAQGGGAAAASGGQVAQAGAAVDEDKEWSKDELMARGEEVYNVMCAACHQVNGEGLAAAGFPPLKGSVLATSDLAAHIDQVLNGKPGTAMAAFGSQLSDLEVAAVVTYERNAWGNDTGDVVQPADIKAAR